MGIRIVRNDLPRLRRAIKKFATTDAAKIAAEVLQDQIWTRTFSGHDVEGKAFKPYTASYALERKALSRPVVPPDLLVYGDMTGSLQFRKKVTAAAGTGKALAVSAKENPKAVGNQNHRQWVGVSSLDIPPIERQLALRAVPLIKLYLQR